MNTAPSPIWHPFTQHGLTPDMVKIDRAEGAYLYTLENDRIIDAISSWWVITHGHCHPTIVDAVKDQAGKLDQLIFAGHTHAPAEALAKSLVEMAPAGLNRVFYTDSGSTSVEVALKMVLSTYQKTGQPKRNRIVVMEHSYHGDTIGTMSIGERGVFNSPFDPMLFDVDTIPFPKPDAGQATLDAFEALLKKNADTTAALIVEPLVLGAGGMLMYSAEVLKGLSELCKAYDTVFIADEIMTGWGRTGTMFACEQAGVTPDIMCTSKGLTGGYLPLAATLCQDRFFEAHLAQDRSQMFFHSSSFMANPLSCAAANANIEIWKSEPVMERIRAIEGIYDKHFAAFQENPRFTNLRRRGTIAALDVVVKDGGYFAGVGPALYDYFQERGILLRPLGNTVYILPPYCMTDDDFAEIFDALAKAPDLLGL